MVDYEHPTDDGFWRFFWPPSTSGEGNTNE